MSFKDELKEVWSKELEHLYEIDPANEKERYKVQAERVSHIEKQITELEKTDIEVDERATNKDIDERIESERIESDNKNQKTKNAIEVLKIVVPVVSAFAMGLISMKWEKTDTLTSTAGKSSLRDILRFK